MNLTYEIINDGAGYIIKRDGVNWVLQDVFIPYPAATIEESAQNHIGAILTENNTEPSPPTNSQIIEELQNTSMTLIEDNEMLKKANLDIMDATAMLYEENLSLHQQLLDIMDATAMIYEEVLVLKGGN